MTKYRIKIKKSWFKTTFEIEKYIYHPDGPDDYNGMPTSLAGWYWTPCDEHDIPNLHNKLNKINEDVV